MAVLDLQCPKCGAQLDPGASSGQGACGYCGGRFLLSAGGVRPLGCFSLPVHHDIADLQAEVGRLLATRGITEVVDITPERGAIRYLMRRGRARITPIPGESSNRTTAKRYEQAREGLFGIPMTGQTDLSLVYLPDTASLEEVPGQVPPDIDDELLRFDDRLRDALEVDLDASIRKQTGLSHAWAGYDVSLNWHDDVYLLDIPVVVFRFHWPDPRREWLHTWSGLREDGRYEVTWNLHDGAELGWGAPRRGVNWLTILLIFLFVTVVLPTVGSVALTVFFMVVGFVISLVMAGAGAMLG